MKDSTQEIRFSTDENQWSVLEEIARDGARRMLQRALENEVAEYIEKHSAVKDEKGNRKILRNGYMPDREIVTSIGPVRIK